MTTKQEEQWPLIIAALRRFLAAQAGKESEVIDLALLSAVEPNIRQALQIDVEATGFARPGTAANGALRALGTFVVHVCQEVWQGERRQWICRLGLGWLPWGLG